jgi:hypothetical protein
MALTALVSCALGMGLLAAAWAKVRDFDLFLELVRGYPLPGRLGPRAVAVGVPALEGVLGTALLSLHPLLSRVGAAGTLALLAAVSGAVGYRLLRGEKRFRCGCGGDLAADHSAAAVLLRNALLAAAAGLAVAGPAAGPAGALPLWLTGAGLVLGAKGAAAALRARRFAREWTASG